MTPVHLNLSKELQQFVNGQVEAGQFDGPAGYIETLIERAHKGKENLEALLIEGLDSGDPIPLDADEWSRIREDVARHNTIEIVRVVHGARDLDVVLRSE